MSFPKNLLVDEVVVSVEVVVVVMGEVVVAVLVEVVVVVVVDPEVDVVVVVEGTGVAKFAGSCWASNTVQSTPMSLPSDAAFLYGLVADK